MVWSGWRGHHLRTSAWTWSGTGPLRAVLSEVGHSHFLSQAHASPISAPPVSLLPQHPWAELGTSCPKANQGPPWPELQPQDLGLAAQLHTRRL